MLSAQQAKPTSSQILLSIALGLSGAFLIILGIIFFFGNQFALVMGSVDGTNTLILLFLSGLPFVILGTLCLLAIPIILHKRWILFTLIGGILIGLAYLFQAFQD